jgi:hypothetical protein
MLLCTLPSGGERTPVKPLLTSHGPATPCRSEDLSTRLRAIELSHTIAASIPPCSCPEYVPNEPPARSALCFVTLRGVACAHSIFMLSMQVTFKLSQCAIGTEHVAYKVSRYTSGMPCSRKLCSEQTACKVFLGTAQHLEAAWWWPRCFRRNEKGSCHLDDEQPMPKRIRR